MLKKIINKELEEVDSLKGYKQLRTLLMYINLGLNEKYSRQFRQVEANLEHKNRADSYSYILNAPDGFNMLARYFCEANYSELNCELAYFELIWKTKC